MDDADSGEDRGERAQTGPIPALAATVVVGAALALYASTLYGVFPSTSDPRVAEPTLERATEAVVDDGIARPDDLANALDAAPAGYDAAVCSSPTTNDGASGRRVHRTRPAPPAP